MMAKTVRVISPAKLNLYLEVLDKRPDGYHTISTLFERISLADEITIKESQDNSITIESDSKEMPLDSRNLVYKAATLLKNSLGIKKGVRFRIKKRIPLGAGLGGGSSNAAATLIGLNQLWRLRLSRRRLCEYAAELGSDVAFFIADVSFAWGSSRGEKVKPFAPLHKKIWHIVLVPPISVSTKEIYREFDKNAGLCGHNADTRTVACRRNFTIDSILFNRLEEITFRKYPEVRILKENLRACGLTHVLMSGSGGSVFGIVHSRKEGLEIAAHFQHGQKVKVFVVKTI